MTFSVLDLDGNVVEQIELDKSIYSQPIRLDIIHRVIEWQRAKRRAGTHATKGISQVSGTTKKPHSQKGTGRARQGSLRSPQFRGGGVIFGPVVRSHEYDLQKKVRDLGIKTALSLKHAEGKLIVLNNLQSESHKTKSLTSRLSKLGIASCLVVGFDRQRDVNFGRAYGNIPRIDALPSAAINVYDVMKHEHLVLTSEAVATINARFT